MTRAAEGSPATLEYPDRAVTIEAARGPVGRIHDGGDEGHETTR